MHFDKIEINHTPLRESFVVRRLFHEMLKNMKSEYTDVEFIHIDNKPYVVLLAQHLLKGKIFNDDAVFAKITYRDNTFVFIYTYQSDSYSYIDIRHRYNLTHHVIVNTLKKLGYGDVTIEVQHEIKNSIHTKLTIGYYDIEGAESFFFDSMYTHNGKPYCGKFDSVEVPININTVPKFSNDTEYCKKLLDFCRKFHCEYIEFFVTFTFSGIKDFINHTTTSGLSKPFNLIGVKTKVVQSNSNGLITMKIIE